MSIASLKAGIISNVVSAIDAQYANLANDHRLTGLTTNDYWEVVALGLATAIVNEINANAKCSGFDSGGDNHNTVSVQIT